MASLIHSPSRFIARKWLLSKAKKKKAFLCNIKGAFSGLRPFLATGSPLKMMKNAFYFTSKALFVFKIFKFLS